jgi:hypothetical protein
VPWASRFRSSLRPDTMDRQPLLLFNGISANLELVEPFMRTLAHVEAAIFDVPGVGGVFRVRSWCPAGSRWRDAEELESRSNFRHRSHCQRRRALCARFSLVGFDVCYAMDAQTLVVSHDPPLHIENTLTLDAALSFLSQTDLELFVEIKETGLASVVIEKLVSSNVADRSVVFAFAAVARSFPWRGARPVRLGVIVRYPWNLSRAVRAYSPDVLFLGWDSARLDADRVPDVVVRLFA